ncbi:hypothetical protein XENOCAPTIV_006489 [Xenoophorus captivus]|uniref:Sphingomyelin phosphodiesterase 4 n=1 Tax=Xenoophorus captivus TaxID=1517983 RepID=A0ABV0S7F1_9TELE
MSTPSLQQPSFLLANLKADATTKHLIQRCLPGLYKELHLIFPWLVENVFGSLDGIISGWNLRLLHSRSNEYNGPVKVCIQEGVLPDCPLFHNKLQFPPPGVLTPNLALSPAQQLDRQRLLCVGGHVSEVLPARRRKCSSVSSVQCVVCWLRRSQPKPPEASHFPPAVGERRPCSPGDLEVRDTAADVCRDLAPSLLLGHVPETAVSSGKDLIRSVTLSEQIQFCGTRCWGSSQQHAWQHRPDWDSRIPIITVGNPLGSLCSGVQHQSSGWCPACFSTTTDWIIRCFKKLGSFSVSLTWSGFPPSRTLRDDFLQRSVLDSRRNPAAELWSRLEPFVHENLLMYTKLFQGFLNRAVRTDLVNAKNALMVFRVAKVFAQPNLTEMIQKGEQLFLEPEHVLHHRQPRGYLTPSQGGSYLSSRQRVVTDTVLKVKSHVYSLEGQDCQYKQMFGSEVRGAVLKFIQIIAQARQTAKRISDHSNEAAANNSILSWFGLGSSDLNNTFSGAEPEDSGECLKKTHEFLDRALENLCQIFKVRSGFEFP